MKVEMVLDDYALFNGVKLPRDFDKAHVETTMEAARLRYPACSLFLLKLEPMIAVTGIHCAQTECCHYLRRELRDGE